jgi:hypothetical protein
VSGIKTYKKKIAAYIQQQEESSKSNPPSKSGKGLLAPKETTKAALDKQKTSVDYVSEYVYALRKQRNQIREQRSKN